jgi:hypothetical protein
MIDNTWFGQFGLLYIQIALTVIVLVIIYTLLGTF